jgi:hypothetical protein
MLEFSIDTDNQHLPIIYTPTLMRQKVAVKRETTPELARIEGIDSPLCPG